MLATDMPATAPGAPRPVLRTRDGVVLVVGLVLGAGIFRAPQVVAANAGGTGAMLVLWAAGGLVSLLGALCYAELATAYPHAGGEYHLLSRAYGERVGFLCAWSRMTVIQTGSLAILAFVVADYAMPLLGLPAGAAAGPAVAAVVVAVLTLVNAAGIRQGRATQWGLTLIEVLGLVLVTLAGLLVAPAGATATAAVQPAEGGSSAIGLALIFVLLTYGGWSEAAYLSAELRDRQRGVLRTLAWGVGVVTLLYLAANVAYLRALGPAGVAATPAVAAEVMRRAAGPWGERFVACVVIAAALSSANATVITGARSTFAVGQDVPAFRWLGAWRARAGTPARAVLVQGAVTLLLVLFGSAARGGFEAMVTYTAPVFWLTLLGTGAAVIVLRRRDPATPRPVRVPLYPLIPVVFCAAAAYMLYASVAHAGPGALLGVAVMLAGLPVLALARRAPAPARSRSPSSLTP
ncbi:MAG TPA: APC family permease [Gemmatimonadaceae bacterium]|nr:APC family permease [Gemmatimonadaceae bacterium]